MSTEQKSSHTPGPWRVGDAGMTVFGPPNQPVLKRIASLGNGPIASPEKHANAHLISAAPDLLEALRECITEDGALAWLNAQFAGQRLEAISRTARNAIAKAEGRS